MKALVRFNHFINFPPKSIEKRQYAEYFGIFLSCVCGAFANLVLFFVFLIESVHILTFFSITGVALWSLGAFLARQGKFSNAVYIGLFEFVMHVPIIAYVIGTGYGMQLIMWSAIAFTTFKTTKKPWVASAMGVAVVIELTLIYALLPKFTDIRPFAGAEDIFFVAMVAMTAMPLLFVLLRLKSIQIKQRKRLQKQIYRDELTGLYNRSFLYELLEYELEMMTKARAPFCLCFADVDHFKKVNDTYGHQIGDEVLIGIADALNANLRKSDVICRWGGEEFVIVLPRCGIDIAPAVIEKVRQALKETAMSSEQLNITMSFGLVCLTNTESLDDTLKRADELLYKAKTNGRDCIEIERIEAKSIEAIETNRP